MIAQSKWEVHHKKYNQMAESALRNKNATKGIFTRYQEGHLPFREFMGGLPTTSMISSLAKRKGSSLFGENSGDEIMDDFSLDNDFASSCTPDNLFVSGSGESIQYNEMDTELNELEENYEEEMSEKEEGVKVIVEEEEEEEEEKVDFMGRRMHQEPITKEMQTLDLLIIGNSRRKNQPLSSTGSRHSSKSATDAANEADSSTEINARKIQSAPVVADRPQIPLSRVHAPSAPSGDQGAPTAGQGRVSFLDEVLLDGSISEKLESKDVSPNDPSLEREDKTEDIPSSTISQSLEQQSQEDVGEGVVSLVEDEVADNEAEDKGSLGEDGASIEEDCNEKLSLPLEPSNLEDEATGNIMAPLNPLKFTPLAKPLMREIIPLTMEDVLADKSVKITALKKFTGVKWTIAHPV